ncbi:MAG: chlorite dismutase family protein [Acidimicrobiia bacterium]
MGTEPSGGEPGIPVSSERSNEHGLGIAGQCAPSLRVMEPVVASSGWGVLHLFFTVDRDLDSAGVRDTFADLGAKLIADGHQALPFAVLGNKADFGVMAVGPDLARLQRFQQELLELPIQCTWSYVSLTEHSEYSATEDDERARLMAEEGLSGDELQTRLDAWNERIVHYREARVHPTLPNKRVVCFYPMSKRRDGDANWFTLPFDERKALMLGHGRVGRQYAGRVTQLITGSTGLDDWEWGVTLFADDPVAIKEIVYEMRFDEASARFAEFGPFVIGLAGTFESVADAVGLR